MLRNFSDTDLQKAKQNSHSYIYSLLKKNTLKNLFERTMEISYILRTIQKKINVNYLGLAIYLPQLKICLKTVLECELNFIPSLTLIMLIQLLPLPESNGFSTSFKGNDGICNNKRSDSRVHTSSSERFRLAESSRK